MYTIKDAYATFEELDSLRDIVENINMKNNKVHFILNEDDIYFIISAENEYMSCELDGERLTTREFIKKIDEIKISEFSFDKIYIHIRQEDTDFEIDDWENIDGCVSREAYEEKDKNIKEINKVLNKVKSEKVRIYMEHKPKMI